MGLRDRLGRLLGLERRSATGIGSGFVPAAPVLSGTYVTPQTAIGLTSVFAAINVISRDVATLPLHVYKRLSGGGREIAAEHPVEDVLAVQANDDVDAFRLRRDSMGHTLGWGNGYQKILRSARGEVEGLHLLHPAKTVAKVPEGGTLRYELEGDPRKILLPEDVLHFAGLGFNGLTGYSPLTVARQSIGLAIAAEQFGASFFGNGAVARGIIKLAKGLRGQALTNVRNSINQIHQGSQNAHQFMLLEEGMDWINTQVNPDDAQFLATRQFTVLEIARIFSMPPHKLGDYSQSHLANVEQSNIDYVTTTLVGWLVMLEAQYNLKLLTRAERKRYVILHDMSALLRGDMASRIAFYRGMREMGCFSADDILASEGRNPIGPGKGGDKHLVQMQYQPLERAGEPPLAKPSEPPAKRSRAKRHNPNHGEDGKFTSGAGGGGGGGGGGGKFMLGGYRGMDDDAMEQHADAYGDRLADHKDPAGELAKDFPEAADKEWTANARKEHKELLDDQKREAKEQLSEQKDAVKGLERDQRDESKELEKSQRDEVKEQDKEQAAERKKLEREQAKDLKEKEQEEDVEPEDVVDLQDTHKIDRDDQAAQHAADRDELKAGQEIERKTFDEDQADARKSLESDHEYDRDALAERHLEDRKGAVAYSAMELMQKSAELAAEAAALADDDDDGDD